MRPLETVEVRFEWYDCYPLFLSYSLNVFAENVNISAFSLVLSMQKLYKIVILYKKTIIYTPNITLLLYLCRVEDRKNAEDTENAEKLPIYIQVLSFCIMNYEF